MSRLISLRETPRERSLGSILKAATVLVMVPSIAAIAFNMLRPNSLPLIADTNYIDEILVPCPENIYEVEPITLDELGHDLDGITFVDARTSGEFVAGHIPGAVHSTHRATFANNDGEQTALADSLARLRNVPGEQIVVCGDPRISSGIGLAAVLLENQFTGVRYLEGGCEVWILEGRTFESSVELATAISVVELPPNLEGLTVIDARFSRYYRRGHLPGAQAISYRMLDGPGDNRLDPLRTVPGSSLLVYGSQSRGEGENLANLMSSTDWQGVRYLEGGFEAWEEAGLPVEVDGDDQSGGTP